MADATGAAAAQVDLTIQAGALLSVRIDNVKNGQEREGEHEYAQPPSRQRSDIMVGVHSH